MGFMQKFFFKKLPIILLACALTLGQGGCASTPAELKMAPLESMPLSVRNAPPAVQQAYQFNAANPQLMQQIPCYCGCGDIGHTSNYQCYIRHQGADGTLTFDEHALGCSICVDITQDTMRLYREGKTVAQIKAYIDATYAKYGTSNMP